MFVCFLLLLRSIEEQSTNEISSKQCFWDFQDYMSVAGQQSVPTVQCQSIDIGALVLV